MMRTADVAPRTRQVTLPVGAVSLVADLVVPPDAKGVVLFAHGSGSSRRSPRNRFVAGELQRAGLATLLFDLLTWSEARQDELTRTLRFDIEFLSRRMTAVTELVAGPDLDDGLPIGIFGASTGAAAALIAAAARPEMVRAVVSRGGRPDLAAARLRGVKAPTLLIVGGDDPDVIALNRRALDAMTCTRALEIVPGATHLFEEPGALERVAELARDWFVTHLA
ncbi:MAG: dienelactone hydrolase family protein [Gemmatimonadales bacterium]|nr:dienelactone hydrolase family protein [Gemmatimonadales bacterium]